jgi:hypothetical protein
MLGWFQPSKAAAFHRAGLDAFRQQRFGKMPQSLNELRAIGCWDWPCSASVFSRLTTFLPRCCSFRPAATSGQPSKAPPAARSGVAPYWPVAGCVAGGL